MHPRRAVDSVHHRGARGRRQPSRHYESDRRRSSVRRNRLNLLFSKSPWVFNHLYARSRGFRRLPLTPRASSQGRNSQGDRGGCEVVSILGANVRLHLRFIMLVQVRRRLRRKASAIRGDPRSGPSRRGSLRVMVFPIPQGPMRRRVATRRRRCRRGRLPFHVRLTTRRQRTRRRRRYLRGTMRKFSP